ncbi:MAG: fibronectin type III domain-containing protein [Tunicatimonas sp.]
MKRIICIFFLLLLGSLSRSAHAQQYPVQASVQLLPPYSVYLSDYANERLVVQLQLRDISKGEIPVRLRWQIRGGGVYLETNTTYLPVPNTVGVGIPLRLDGYDLAPYLRPENLLGNGGTAAWRRQAQLPEGRYTFCVQVLDDVTGAVVSNAACASAWLLRHEPPFLNLPESEAKPEARDPQQLTFQWTPRHTGRPNANFQTEYDFRLVEIWPDDRDPNDAMQSSIPLYETTTASTMLMYGMAEPLLIPGRRYAWQVRARSLVNGESLALFNNRGDSEVRSFRWGDACGAITDVRAEALSGGRIRLRWDPAAPHSSYRVQYRQKGSSRWYQQESFQPEVIITRLQPNTAYEYQVGGYCGSIAAGLSTLASVGTLEEVVPEYACGLPVPAPNQESANPLPLLRVGEVIQAADFPVTVTESSGQSGRFSGKGTVALPWLRASVAQVTFQDVQINEAYQLTVGELVVTGVALEVVPEELTDALAGVYDVAEQTAHGLEYTDEALNAVKEALPTTPEGSEEAPAAPTETPSSSDAEAQPTAAEAPPTNGGSAPATDGPGGGVNVADGSPGSSGGGPRSTAVSRAQDSVDIRVRFRPNANQVYGFDRKEHDVLATDYPLTLVGGETYTPAWKSVAAGRTDHVDAVAVAPDSSSVVVKFRSATGRSIVAQPGAEASEQQLLLVGTTHETVDALTAYVVEADTAGNETETTVGQLNVISYDELRQKVIVVPVNDAATPDAVRLSQDLNAIYGAAVAHWEVAVDDPFVAEAELLAGLDEGESGLLASFPRPMRQFNRAFRRSRDIDKDAYYVFLVAGSSASRAGQSRQGFMPFKQQFGYIFTERTGNLSQTIAHELGHGAFRLRHPFDEFDLAKGTTDNLMDYREGAKLYKYQWDNVHDPEAMVGWLQDDDESAAVAIKTDHENVLALFNAIREANYANKKELNVTSFIKNKTYSYQGRVNILDKDVDLIVEHWFYSGEHKIDPGQEYLHEQGEKFVYQFDGYLASGKMKPLLKIYVDRDKAETLGEYLFGERNQPIFAITTDQLKEIFPNTDEERIREVVAAINNYSNKFELTTKDKMAHFIAQIGTDTAGLKKLTENSNYGAEAIFKTFIKVKRTTSQGASKKTHKYCDLIDEYNCEDCSSCPDLSNYEGPNLCSTTPDYYFPTKIVDGETLPDYSEWDETKDVKTSYINSSTIFDYVYGCRLGNGAKSTEDGSNFKGIGFIHLTGKGTYKEVSEAWNEIYPDDKKEFHGDDINLLKNDIDVAIKASLVYWKMKDINAMIDGGEQDLLEVTAKVNLGYYASYVTTTTVNGYNKRKNYYNKAKESL